MSELHESCDPDHCTHLLRARLERAEKEGDEADKALKIAKDQLAEASDRAYDYKTQRDEAVRLIDQVRFGCIPWDALQAFMDKHGGYTDLSRVGAKEKP